MRPGRMRIAVPLALAVFVAACGGSGAKTPTLVLGITADADSLAFGAVVLGDTAYRTFSLSNQGSDAATVALDVVGTDGGEFSVGDQRQVEIGPGGVIDVVVGYRPASVGAHSAQLRLSAGEQTLLVDLTGTARLAPGAPGPVIAVDPLSLFIPVPSGLESRHGTVTVMNAGTRPLHFGSGTPSNWTRRAPRIESDHPANFSVEGVDAATLSNGLPAGQSLVLVVTATPVSAQALSATLIIDSDDPNQPTVSVPVSVQAAPVASCIPDVWPRTLSLGAIEPGDYALLTLTLTNSGDAEGACELLGIDVTGDGAANVEVQITAFPVVFGPGATLLVPLKVRIGEGESATVAFDIPNAVVPVAVEIRGPPTPPKCFLAPPIAFFNVWPGCKGVIPVTLTATCDATFEAVSLDVIGDDATEFTASPAVELPASVSMGGSFALRAEFHPSVVGFRTATLQVNFANAHPLQVPMTGNGSADGRCDP